jgi:ribosome-binding protein aMBF1 (putative translation factor)
MVAKGVLKRRFVDRNRPSARERGQVMRKFIPVEEVAKEWMKNPAFVAEYDALEDEFALASALIKTRADANMTQEDVAKAMGTTQAAVARLEGGRTMPSTRTLERFAKATGTRLRISFEPAKSHARSRRAASHVRQSAKSSARLKPAGN